MIRRQSQRQVNVTSQLLLPPIASPGPRHASLSLHPASTDLHLTPLKRFGYRCMCSFTGFFLTLPSVVHYSIIISYGNVTVTYHITVEAIRIVGCSHQYFVKAL